MPDAALLERMKTVAPGHYTERDGGLWYIVVPSHDERLGEDFADRDHARQFVCWLAGDQLPHGWKISPSGTGRIAYDLKIPDQYGPATIWARPCRRYFPARATDLPETA
jgi:hypothetical protein